MNNERLPERPVKLGSHEIDYSYHNGCLYLNPVEELAPYPEKLTDRLIENAQKYPTQTFVAQRDSISRNWVHLSYAEVLEKAWHIAQALHNRPLSEERPVLILSGNDLQHLLLAQSSMLAGVPYSAVSPAYSLVSHDFAKLKHVFATLTPGLVFAADGQSYAAAIKACADKDVEIVTLDGRLGEVTCTAFDELLQTPVTDVQQHYATLDQNHIAKMLFTSGSTGSPKIVPTTHKMLCANQQMLLQTFPEFGIEPPVLLDWLPWHHTFGGSHNVGIVEYNHGTLYIDDGKPVPGKFEETIRNLKEISPTMYLNVPKGWEDLTHRLEEDEELRNHFFKRIKILFFAGAALSDSSWNRLDELAIKHCGESIRIMSGLGMTETSPSCLFTTGPKVMAGFVGYPAPGCEVKLVPIEDKMELRVRGPHVMKGYWRITAQEAEKQFFDEEGYFCTGDAVKLVCEDDPSQGMMYDGRIAEDFKLNTGTFVNVGTLRNRALLLGNELIQDVCVTGHNQASVGMLIFPKVAACAHLAGLPENTPVRELLVHPVVQEWFRNFLIGFNGDSTSSARTIHQVYIMETPPSLDRGEMTDKGNLNQRTILRQRAQEVEALYGEVEHPLIYRI